jgi:predicted transcriptional regulator
MHTVEELMSRPVKTVRADDDVGTLRGLMRSEHVHAAPVVDDAGRLVGIVTSSDLVDASDPQLGVRSVMSTDVVTCSPHTPVTDAVRSMLDRGVRHLVVTRRDEVVGMFSSFDALHLLVGRVRRTTAPDAAATEAAGSSTRLHAEPGDVIVVRPRRLGEHERRATVIEAGGEGGTAPFTVRWADDPHDDPHLTIYFPGSDAYVEHHTHA